MPAAYYEISANQGSDFTSTFKLVKPGGGLYKFLPILEQATSVNGWIGPNNNGTNNLNPFWYNLAVDNSQNHVFGITIPEELKIQQIGNESPFSWLKTINNTDFGAINNKQFISISSQIRNSSNNIILSGTTVYKTKVLNDGSLFYEQFINPDSNSNCKQIVQFKFIPNNTQYNIFLNIPSSITDSCGGATRNCDSSSGNPPTNPKGTMCFRGSFLYDVEISYNYSLTKPPFVMRMLQGKVTFNPNVTTI